MVAQQIASSYPEMIRHLILCGTAPRGGENLTYSDLSLDDLKDPPALLLRGFFAPSDASQAAGHAYLARLTGRQGDRDEPVTMAAATTQFQALLEWGQIPSADRYAVLSTIQQPTLVVHGTKDLVIDLVNAFILGKNLHHATLLMLPDASHAAHSQHAEVFLTNARLFLSS